MGTMLPHGLRAARQWARLADLRPPAGRVHDVTMTTAPRAMSAAYTERHAQGWISRCDAHGAPRALLEGYTTEASAQRIADHHDTEEHPTMTTATTLTAAALAPRAGRIIRALLADDPALAHTLASHAAAALLLTTEERTAAAAGAILDDCAEIARESLAALHALDADAAALLDAPAREIDAEAAEVLAAVLRGLAALRTTWDRREAPAIDAAILYGMGGRLREAVDALAEVLRRSTEGAEGLADAATLEGLAEARAALEAARAVLDRLDPFAGAEVIAAYTAADAEADGLLWRMPAEIAGPAMPVLLTRAAYADAVQWERSGGWNDETGRAHDVAMLLRMGPGTAALRAPGRPALLKVLRIPNRTPRGALSTSTRATMARLEVLAEGYDLTGAPCLIVRLEGERD